MPDYQSYRSTAYDPYEERYAKQYGIPVELLRSIRLAGERSNANQVSPAGARGVFQFTPPTRQGFIKNYHIDPWAGPEQNTQAAALHLSNDWKRSHGDVGETVMSYIAGPSGKGRGPQTHAYLGRVQNQMKSLGYGAKPVDDDETDQADLAVSPSGGANGSTSSLAVKQGPAAPAAFDVLQQSRKSISDLYDQAGARLADHYQGPGVGELLMALGSRIMQPMENNSFGNVLANASQEVAPWFKDRREFRNARLKEQAGLDLAKAKDLADLERTYLTGTLKGAGGAGFVWSEKLGRFIPKPSTANEPVIVGSGTLEGHHTEGMSDGTQRVYDIPGDPNAYTLIDAGGNVVGQGKR